MKSFNLSIYVLFVLSLFMFTSCQKENMDDTTTKEEEVEVEEVTCETAILIAEQPPGSGEFYTSVTDGTPPYTYLWSTGETTANITVTDEGTYSVTVTDADDCVADDEIMYSESDPCLNFSTSISEDPIGTLTSITNIGTAPYTYEWSTGETTASINVTADGTYSVLVTDAEGCTAQAAITLTLPDPCETFLTEIEGTPAGVLFANATGGTAPYAYSWSTGETTATINVMDSGTYTVTVVDADGCTFETNYFFAGSNPCNSLIVTIENPQATTLFTNTLGGPAPYTYLWSTGETTSIISAPTASGTYSVTVTDDNGCTAEDDFEF